MRDAPQRPDYFPCPVCRRVIEMTATRWIGTNDPSASVYTDPDGYAVLAHDECAGQPLAMLLTPTLGSRA